MLVFNDFKILWETQNIKENINKMFNKSNQGNGRLQNWKGLKENWKEMFKENIKINKLGQMKVAKQKMLKNNK